jgi:hypothetical protein
MELPSYPAGDDAETKQEPTAPGRRAIQFVVIAVVAALVVAIVVLHLTGVVGPGTN